MFAEFWAGRLGPYLSPAVVVEAEPPSGAATPASPVVGTKFEDTADAVVAAEAVVLGELAALIANDGRPLSPWEACRELFAPAAVSGSGGGGSGDGLASTLAPPDADPLPV